MNTMHNDSSFLSCKFTVDFIESCSDSLFWWRTIGADNPAAFLNSLRGSDAVSDPLLSLQRYGAVPPHRFRIWFCSSKPMLSASRSSERIVAKSRP